MMSARDALASLGPAARTSCCTWGWLVEESVLDIPDLAELAA